MSIQQEALDKVDQHWAVLALGDGTRDRGLELANHRLVNAALRDQMQFTFEAGVDDDDLLERVATAYEMAAIEGLGAFLSISTTDDLMREQCEAAAWRTFEFRRLMAIPKPIEERIYHVLHLSALSYCGDRWSDIRRWYSENPDAVAEPSTADQKWEYRILFRLFGCWIRLFRKEGWDDLDRVREIIAGLREDQKQFEHSALDSGSNSQDRATALRLIAFYNWAKATEILAKFMLQGEPLAVQASLEKHFDQAISGAIAAGDAQLEILLRWLMAASYRMAAGSLWKVAQSINSRVTRFVGHATKHQSMFELLPPQRAALQEQGLLDQAATAVVIDLPTSGGKTLLAQFRILQALNQFAEDGGWVAYVVPTRALSAQITRRLRRDFSPINICVEQLTGAVEVDAIEQDILSAGKGEGAFDVLVTTPEKLQLIIRNKKIPRPLALLVMDEAHNLEDENRGLRIEFLLATIKQESANTNFLLMMPFVEKAETLARWLAGSVQGGKSVSIGTSIWRPNERVVGMFKAEASPEGKAGWHLQFQTLVTSPKTIHLKGEHRVGGLRPLGLAKSKVINAKGEQQGMGSQAAAMAQAFSSRGTSIAVGGTVPNVWSMARDVSASLPKLVRPSERIKLVCDFLKDEVSPEFELVEMLSKGVAVHHSGLSDEIRALVEWLAEENELLVLCTTTTLAQGINFPVSSVFLATYLYPYGMRMRPREFWNLAGRAGRMGHDSVGVVGIAEANRGSETVKFVCEATGELISRLLTVVESLDEASSDDDLRAVIHQEQWEDFRCYVTHLMHETKDLDKVVANADASLRNTFGYRVLRDSAEGRDRADKLLKATQLYAEKISANPGQVAMADMTGFSYEGVGKALGGIETLERDIDADTFSSEKLFGSAGGLADLYGVMLKIPQLQLDEITDSGVDKKKLAQITKDWVDGKTIQEIASLYFKSEKGDTNEITNACKAIYRNLVNNGTWGLSALSRLSGIKFDELSEEQKRQIDLLPAMIYHGVKSEEGVLMRMNGIPRCIAEGMGDAFRGKEAKADDERGIVGVRKFLESADNDTWENARPANSSLDGVGYKDIWKVISGESTLTFHERRRFSTVN